MKFPKGVGVSELQNLELREFGGQEIGSLHSGNPDLDLDCPSIGTGGNNQEPVDISHVGFSRFRRTGGHRHLTS